MPEDGITRLAGELAGRDVAGFFARCVDGTDDPPLAALLATVGVTLNLRAADNAAERAGVAAGDVLIAIDGLRVSGNSVETMLGHRRAGETLTVHAFRCDELFTTAPRLSAALLDTCWLTQDEGVASEAQARRTTWLGPG